MSKTKLRDRETARKKRRQKIPRAKVTKALGNTGGVRTRAKKTAGLRRGRAAAAKG